MGDQPTFEHLLNDPTQQLDEVGEVGRTVSAHQHGWTEASWQLCDDDGTVRRGAMHNGIDYECTGSAHYAGFHITCTNPVHVSEEAVYEREYLRWDGGE